MVARQQTTKGVITDTALSEQEADALRVVLSGKGVKPGEVSLEVGQSTLERVQQQLDEKGYKDLATNLRAKLSEGMSQVTVTVCISVQMIIASVYVYNLIMGGVVLRHCQK